ncbi:ABC transporter ATP-binding protein [Tahibacter amnicola]|uniref:ABC transporter ATP-binding protein n=1 Tax=Tahibacter amnicola TaxID=2976241 RepID=A0ABY6B8J4_9GAMM|nr:ABC transporter ATP-binding protein [Tahibacter amnicola]UXI66195.1 ABC transporter ATP-binding protein [Tahibacter amnicola]
MSAVPKPTLAATSAAPATVLMHAAGVSKSYAMGDVAVPALAEIDVCIEADRLTVLSGPSGSGKSTLLNVLGCLDRPSQGTVRIGGLDTNRLTENALSDLRARRIGFVFQHFNLLQVLTALENVEYPLVVLGVTRTERRRRAREMLDAVGLADYAGHRPGQLSGGQRQRVAIARALVKKPDIVLADEPTANLDSGNGSAVISLLRQMQRDTRTAVVISSHDPLVVGHADRVIRMRDGRIVAEG